MGRYNAYWSDWQWSWVREFKGPVRGRRWKGFVRGWGWMGFVRGWGWMGLVRSRGWMRLVRSRSWVKWEGHRVSSCHALIFDISMVTSVVSIIGHNLNSTIWQSHAIFKRNCQIR
jgi:hypothetical protein